MTKSRKAFAATAVAVAVAATTWLATTTPPTPTTVTTTRAVLVQFVVPNDSEGVWLPVTPGLWRWRRVLPDGRLAEAKLILVSDPGVRGDNAVCIPVEALADGSLKADAEAVKSVRELPAGYWTFVRPLAAGDPEIPQA